MRFPMSARIYSINVSLRLVKLSENMDSESDVDDIFEVEKILDAKRKDGKILFRVRWEGYGSEEDSWEPSDNLLTCQELVDRYWQERNEQYKKRGRKAKHVRETTDEDSDGSDTEDGREDVNNKEKEMTLPQQKRKRGRPPKRNFSDTDTADQYCSTSPETSDQNSHTKRRKPSNKHDNFLFEISPKDFLLLDCGEIAPLGLTRQASKELALVSLRKKQESQTLVNSKSQVDRTISGAVLSNTKEDDFVEAKRKDSKEVETEENSFEVIEISSQGTEDEEEQTSLQSSEPIVAECILISSQSESEDENEGSSTKSSQNSSKTKLKKKATKPGKSLIKNTENNDAEKFKERVELQEGCEKLHNNSVEELSTENNTCSKIDAFPPIDFNSENKVTVTEETTDKEFSEKIPEVVQIEKTKILSEQSSTDENSNQVSPLVNPINLPPMFSKMKSLYKKTTKGKNSLPGTLENSTLNQIRSDSEQESTDLLTNSKDEVVAISSLSMKNSIVSTFPDSSIKQLEARIIEASVNRKDNKDMDADTSVGYSDQDIAMLKRKNEKSTKGKARKTGGRPRPVKEMKRKRTLIDSSTAVLHNPAVSPISENIFAGLNETSGKQDKQMSASTTAELLPMQNKTSSVPLMDGDLIGAIIQDSGKIDENKTKPLPANSAGKKDGKTDQNRNTQKTKRDETEKHKSWDSGMEDISEGEDDLSDFEFDLDDYSPHSFFNDVEESFVPDRSSSPTVEPLNLSWADLKQAIRGGGVMLVRRALAVPGFNPDMIDTASGMTLLMWAATYGQDDIVKLLIRRGAGVNTDEKRNSMTALIHAAEQGFPETVQILLESGARINWQSTAGETALIRACKKGHEDVVGVLLRHGVDTKARTKYELTATQIALKNQHFEIQNLLSEHEESLANTLHMALGKCLGKAGTLCLPLLMPYRCIAPGEKDSLTFSLIYDSTKVSQGTKVVLFCVRADFNGDEVCLSFGGDNGVRTILLNGSIQYPLVQGNRSVYLLTPDAEALSNELTVQTHVVKSARLIVCAASVSPASKSS